MIIGLSISPGQQHLGCQFCQAKPVWAVKSASPESTLKGVFEFGLSNLPSQKTLKSLIIKQGLGLSNLTPQLYILLLLHIVYKYYV